jgi:hypothetical protein
MHDRKSAVLSTAFMGVKVPGLNFCMAKPFHRFSGLLLALSTFRTIHTSTIHSMSAVIAGSGVVHSGIKVI